MFDGLLFPMLLVGCAVILFLFISPNPPFATKVAIEFPYQRRDRLMTEAEGSFYQVLELALLNGEYRIFGKVRVEDLISVKTGLDHQTRQSFRNRIKSRHIDIVVVEHKTFKPVWAIELDDKSHDSAKRKERDTFVDNAFHAAGLPLVRFKAKRSYTAADIRQTLGVGQTGEINSEAFVGNDESVEPVVEALSASRADDTLDNFCPRCYAPLVKKRVRSGKHAGTEVMSCSRYPKCRKILPIVETDSLRATR